MVVAAKDHGGGAASETVPVCEGATGEGQADVPTKTGKEPVKARLMLALKPGRRLMSMCLRARLLLAPKPVMCLVKQRPRRANKTKRYVPWEGGGFFNIFNMVWLKHFEHFTQS